MWCVDEALVKAMWIAQLVVLAACSSTPSSSQTDASVGTDGLPDAVLTLPQAADCTDAFAYVVADGLVPHGPVYGEFPGRAQPPLAYLAPYECLAVRVESLATGGLHLRLVADATSGWSPTIRIDGATATAVATTLVLPNVVEGTVDVPAAAKYITLEAGPALRPECTRNVSLEQFSDGTVAVVGYGGVDCGGGPR